MRYILLIKDECPYCQKAISFLEDKGIEYSKVSFEEEHQQIMILNEFKEAYGQSTVPMIFSRDGDEIRLVGGCDDLLALYG
jgi:glutaredoxin 3